MVIHVCLSCQRAFVAVSREEAEEAYNEQVQKGGAASASFEIAVDTSEVAYARFCPYCNATTVKVS